MTARRHKTPGGCGNAVLVVILTAIVSSAATAATSERVVQDRHTGLAIGGVDPVAYFTDAKPLTGLADFETIEAAAVWRFRNEGNLARFKARPDVYSPQFGGYDPVDVARGVARPGHPRLWLIVAQRLYLFAREDNRDVFARECSQVLRAAGMRWPQLLTTLAQ